MTTHIRYVLDHVTVGLPEADAGVRVGHRLRAGERDCRPCGRAGDLGRAGASDAVNRHCAGRRGRAAGSKRPCDRYRWRSGGWHGYEVRLRVRQRGQREECDCEDCFHMSPNFHCTSTPMIPHTSVPIVYPIVTLDDPAAVDPAATFKVSP